uniref:Uncharacterized protein n=1 Tax=Oryza meridionalis TaxID=40149 RepID=A0A0E0DRU6_9ORYZ
MWPEPIASGVAPRLARPMSLMGALVLSTALAVVIIADRTAAGLHSGCTALISAATPDACGHDMDVPEMTLKRLYSCWLPTVAALTFSGHEARMREPGASTSGLSTVGQLAAGPRDEKPGSGPSLPAEVDTNTPRCIAAKAPMAMGSR